MVSCGSVHWPSFGRAMVEELNELLEKLTFFEEESNRLFSFTRLSSNSKGYEAWEIGKFTKEEVNFVELREKVILVKFGKVEDRIRILNLALWLFNQSIFSLTPYVKDQEIEKYTLNLSPFWVRVYNIPFDQMDRQTVLEVGEAIGEVMAIDWRDRDGGYIEYIRVKYGNSLRAQTESTTQERGNWRNGVEFLEGRLGSISETQANKGEK
ncbi:hypothetical protein Goklo_007291 [Gossypium klotzschianum]|nr:hypothetical protein [Gossypium klotzschianum]